ncbi:uncharacterized protein DUF4168 [Mesonia algae]|uniref:Uncharacterized protein DUF4168 n=2 Tax=Mesonia algae TaxID=213248 RepID=A0A2W7HXB6_9FLAO|nr:uncharacterized protein DUF4168 [Mesonia algae]
MLKSNHMKNFILALTLLFSAVTLAQTEVSDADLNKFADAYKAVQIENQEVQQEMVEMIKKEGLELSRFQTIQQASVNPNKEVEATQEEMDIYKKVITEIEKMQPELQKEMSDIITDNGLTLDRYQEIGAALQSDQALQQKLQTMMMKQQTKG